VGEAALKSSVTEVLCQSPPCIEPVDEYLGILRQTYPCDILGETYEQGKAIGSMISIK
jgi:hypothetical protein